MPQLFRTGPYLIYFWSNETDLLRTIPLRVLKKSNNTGERYVN